MTEDLQRRRIDPLNDADVRQKVAAGEDLTAIERTLRRLAAQKKPIGGFLTGLGTVFAVVAATYPEKWLIVSVAVLNTAGGMLMGGGSASIKSDEYDQVKNSLLRQRGVM